MNVIFMMLGVTACYTICSLSDKYAIVGAKLDGNEFTFVMCSSMSIFLCFILPFQNITLKADLRALLAVALIATCKMFEFQTSARVLKELSAFELKAWLGTTLFASYFTDILYGGRLKLVPVLLIVTAVVGLFLIARSGSKGKVNYRSIIVPLFLYVLSKYSYGLIIKAFASYILPTLQLFSAFVILSIVTFFMIKPSILFGGKRSGALKVALVRIPNTVGMLLENAVIAVSLSDYSFIQPMILTTLFFIGLLKKDKTSRLSLVGGIICTLSIVLFQIFK